MVSIGCVADTAIAVRPQGRGQEIVILATNTGYALASLLAGGGTKIRHEGNYLLLEHDCNVDERLKQLVDVAISLRYFHPSFTELTLTLENER